MLEAATLLFFPALMVFAAISDLLTMTISNRVSIALAFLFVVMAFACGLSAVEIFWHLACGAAMLVVTFGMFARGWIGGGDAKLAAATAIWLSFDHVGDYALSASVLGGLLTLAIIGLRNWPLPGGRRASLGPVRPPNLAPCDELARFACLRRRLTPATGFETLCRDRNRDRASDFLSFSPPFGIISACVVITRQSWQTHPARDAAHSTAFAAACA
jgi:prepilin peptidase CpaA